MSRIPLPHTDTCSIRRVLLITKTTCYNIMYTILGQIVSRLSNYFKRVRRNERSTSAIKQIHGRDCPQSYVVEVSFLSLVLGNSQDPAPEEIGTHVLHLHHDKDALSPIRYRHLAPRMAS